MTADETFTKPEPFEVELPEGTLRCEIGYPTPVGTWTPAGGMTAERVRWVDVWLNGEPVRGERAAELLSRAILREDEAGCE